MSWTPDEYAENSRLWSVLRYVHAKLGARSGFLAAAVFNPADPALTNYHILWPATVETQPVFILEFVSERNVGGLGPTRREIVYQLTIITQSANADGSDAKPDELAWIWKERLVRVLHASLIPFYDYSGLPAAAVALPSYDFKIFYAGCQQLGDKTDGEKNRLVMEWRVVG